MPVKEGRYLPFRTFEKTCETLVAALMTQGQLVET